MIKCELCQEEFSSFQKFNYHLKIHNITAHEYYDKFLKTETAGYCKICQKPTAWINFTKGYREYCSRKCAMHDLSILDKRKQTCLEKYGTENVFQSETIKQVIKDKKEKLYGNPYYNNNNQAQETVLKKYGTDNFGKIPDAIKKKESTVIKKYGVKNCMQSDIIKEQRKQNALLKYGVPSTNMLDSTKEKYKKTCIEKYGVEYAGQALVLKEKKHNNKIRLYNIFLKHNNYNGEVLKYNDKFVTYKCNICNKISNILLPTFSGRLYEKHINPCIYCNPIHKSYSCLEKEILNYIKSIYTDTIIENDRNILEGKELDIYLPNLKLAFEFDGTYWHADSRFFDKDDIISYNHLPAYIIWENDAKKDFICKEKNIELIRIKEYDWINDNENIKNLIIKTINNRKIKLGINNELIIS